MTTEGVRIGWTSTDDRRYCGEMGTVFNVMTTTTTTTCTYIQQYSYLYVCEVSKMESYLYLHTAVQQSSTYSSIVSVPPHTRERRKCRVTYVCTCTIHVLHQYIVQVHTAVHCTSTYSSSKRSQGEENVNVRVT